MSSEQEEPKSSTSIAMGLVLVISGSALLHFTQTFWGWVLLAIGVYGLVIGIFEPRTGHDKASNMAMVPTVLVFVVALYQYFISKTHPTWVHALSLAAVVILTTTVFHHSLSLLQSNQARHLLRSLLITLSTGGMLAVYHFYAQNIFPLDVIVVFMAVSNLRQGLHEVFTGGAKQALRETALVLLADIFVVACLVGALVWYGDLLFFHMLILTLVLALFRFSTEHFMPEVAARDHRKVDSDHPGLYQGPRLFMALTGLHSSINLLMLPLLIGYMYLSLEQYVAQLNIQTSVFEASIGLLGIVTGFTALVLGERIDRKEQGEIKQSYLLQGLLGITFLFSVIAVVAFLGTALFPLTQQAGLPSAEHMVAQFLTDDELRSHIIVAAANEFTFFAVPSALLYLYSLSKDLIERFGLIPGTTGNSGDSHNDSSGVEKHQGDLDEA